MGEDQIGARRFLGPAAERVTMDSLFDALETEKVGNQRRVPSEMPRLRERWTGYQAMEVTAGKITEWKRELLEAGLSPKASKKLTASATKLVLGPGQRSTRSTYWHPPQFHSRRL